MALKDWLDTGKCLLGFHQGDWKRESPASCVLIQTCDRCRAISQRVEHDWREWRYVSDQSCELERSCDRCEERESRFEHQWGTWLYRREEACDQGIQCTRCGAWAQDSRVEHDWGEWEYQEQYRAPLHACSRCSTVVSYFPDQIVEPSAQEPSNSASAAESAASAFAARCDEILAEFERGLNQQGFSEYLMGQASAGLQELQPQSEDEGRTLRAALVRMIDLAVPHAPPEAAQTFLISREAILQQDAPPQPSLDAAGLRAEGEAVLQRLRDELAAGGLPSPAFMRAQAAMQSLGLRIRDEDEEGAKVLMRMMPELVVIMAPYAESDKASIAADVTATMQQVFGEVEGMLDDDPVRADVAGQAMMREIKRLAQNPTTDPWEQPDALPHQRQFAALLRPWMDRIMALPTLPDADSRDAAEAKRIAKRADVAHSRLRAATTEAQWIEQQRGSLRRVAVELRQFERRYHLMLIEPPWRARPAAVDANGVFFSGSAEAQAVVEAACARIGMAEPVAHGVDDFTHTRWDLLRRSAVAAFDFTAYDRAASDPPGALPRSREKLEAIARAAAPVARVVYEYGWALVLGTATVIIAREGQALPFDIDIVPVYLAGDDEDAMRVVLGLQAALFGVQRGLRTADLGATVNRLREYFASDVKAAGLLEAVVGSPDAMKVQLVAEALLEHAPGHRAMLALPAFPPVYPSADEPRTLFHITAFRPWSKPCEEVVREACSQAGIKYLIGYEQLDPDILRAIWRDIAGASFVVADLTSLNPNAVLELGIAHALGRPTLVLSQTPNLPAHLPALAKVRTHSYATDAVGRLNLSRLLDRYLRDDPEIC